MVSNAQEEVQGDKRNKNKRKKSRPEDMTWKNETTRKPAYLRTSGKTNNTRALSQCE